MKWLIVGAVMGLLPTVANAAPVYLNCVIQNPNDGEVQMNVQLNEEGGTASYTFPARGPDSYRAQAAFTPDRVSFGSFAISRADLSIQRRNDDELLRRARNDPPVDSGRCEIDRRERAF